MFDWTVNLGSILIIAGFAVTGFVTYTKATAWLSIRFSKFEDTLGLHATQLVRHAERMDRYESRYVEIAQDLQRLIGRMESMDDWPPPDRRRHPREPK